MQPYSTFNYCNGLYVTIIIFHHHSPFHVPFGCCDINLLNKRYPSSGQVGCPANPLHYATARFYHWESYPDKRMEVGAAIIFIIQFQGSWVYVREPQRIQTPQAFILVNKLALYLTYQQGCFSLGELLLPSAAMLSVVMG